MPLCGVGGDAVSKWSPEGSWLQACVEAKLHVARARVSCRLHTRSGAQARMPRHKSRAWLALYVTLLKSCDGHQGTFSGAMMQVVWWGDVGMRAGVVGGGWWVVNDASATY